MRTVSFLLAGTALLAAGTAHAELARPLRSMLDAAIASSNDADIDTIAKYLKQASPADAAEIDRTIGDHRAQIAAAKEEKLRHLGLLEGWKGEGQIGATQSSGNATTVGLTAGLGLTRESLRWRFSLRALADYQRNNGQTSRNQMLFAFEPNYRFNERLFAYGLAQYERDRFAGFTSRTTLSGGLGYRVTAQPNFTVDVKAGPAWRKTSYIGEPAASDLTGLAALNARWAISRTLTLTEDANALYSRDNTNLNSLTSLSAKLSNALSARVSYQFTNNSNPPAGFKKTDTVTRFTMVYGF
ncbi:YdiY family protein [Novosphingobium sp. MD-1]|uniref:DUF481 domain-containing protein n=1 Tax=Novosphingobium sp. MD-1 TaxID=1630648 RepID=UPI000F7DE9E4|nr:DUF481 domain-containing protein [Novosphingobium sp. MD-1]